MSDGWLLHNASEYTVNGKTYRNLEAEVKYLHDLTEQNAGDIIQQGERLGIAEDDIDDLQDRMTSAEDELDSLGSTIKVVSLSTTNYNEIDGLVANGYTVVLDASGTYVPMQGISETDARFTILNNADTTVYEWKFYPGGTWQRTQTKYASFSFVEAVEDGLQEQINTLGGRKKITQFPLTVSSGVYSLDGKTWNDVYTAYSAGDLVVFTYGVNTYYLTSLNVTGTTLNNYFLISGSGALGQHCITYFTPWDEGQGGFGYLTSSEVGRLREFHMASGGGGSSVATVTLTYDSVQDEYTADKTYSEINDIIDAEEDVLLIYNYQYYRFNRFRSTDSSYGYPLVFTCTDGFPYSGKIDTFYVENTDEWHHHTLTVDPIATSTSILSGDRVMVGRAVDPDDTRTVGTLAFDTSVTDKFLCQDGTWKSITMPINYVSERLSLPEAVWPNISITTEVNP